MIPLIYLLLSAFVLAVAASWTSGLFLYPFARWLSKYRSRFSSNFWFGVGMFPVVNGTILASIALVSGWMSARHWIPDHCLEHGGHPHLCLAHIESLPPGGLLFWIAAIVAGAFIGYAALSITRANRGALLKIHAVRPDKDGFYLYPSRLPAAFTAGFLSPRAYLTSEADRQLNSEEKAVVLAHEREHVRKRDPLRLLILQFLERWLPGAQYVRAQWQASAELDCDWVAIRQGFSRELVAHTILKVQRATQFHLQSVSLLNYSAQQSSEFLKFRVESLLLEDDRDGIGMKPVLLLFSVLFIASVVFFVEVHHMLETVLGWLT